jgi:hypothetical protein
MEEAPLGDVLKLIQMQEGKDGRFLVSTSTAPLAPVSKNNPGMSGRSLNPAICSDHLKRRSSANPTQAFEASPASRRSLAVAWRQLT